MVDGEQVDIAKIQVQLNSIESHIARLNDEHGALRDCYHTLDKSMGVMTERMGHIENAVNGLEIAMMAKDTGLVFKVNSLSENAITWKKFLLVVMGATGFAAASLEIVRFFLHI